MIIPHSLYLNPSNTSRKSAALICTGAYKHTETQIFMQELGWESLATCRKQHKFALYYKIINHIYPDYLFNLIPNPVSEYTNYNLRNRYHLWPKKSRLKSSQTSFIPSTTRLWNNLPENVKSLPSLFQFKTFISNKI